MTATVGLIGLGTMGSALALNIAEKGHTIAVFNRTVEKGAALADQAGDLADRLVPTESLEAFVAAITPPRMILLMVPAGEPVDDQIAALLPLLDADDLIIDAGNANFRDTVRRMDDLNQPFLGIGVSGGEEGARHGPAIMVGGPEALWERARPVLTDIAARAEGEPCADWMGESGAGHFVKAVHNGIEYADMQIIAEAYGLMRDGLQMSMEDIAETFRAWNDGPLSSYLIEISGEVAAARDAATGGPLLDVIVDAAGQKGTGRWTVIEAQHLGAPISVIDAAVAARNISAQIGAREEGQRIFGAAPQALADGALDTADLSAALLCGKIVCYDQGFRMIGRAAEAFGWTLDGARIARVWRAGCIIRSSLLADMAEALEANSTWSLMDADQFAKHLSDTHAQLRKVVSAATAAGHPVPALSAALAYFDAMRTSRGTADMIQGQRDYFGRHGFVRRDTGAKDSHGPWAD